MEVVPPSGLLLKKLKRLNFEKNKMSDHKFHECKIVIRLADNEVFSKTGKHLSKIENLVLEGTWKGLKYPQIAIENGYASEYLRNDIGPKLWRRLSKAFEEKVCKANVRIVLESRLFEISKDTIDSHNKATQKEIISTEELENNNTIIKYKFINSNSSNISSLQSKKKTFTVHNLPRQSKVLIGRELEKQKLLDWLLSEHAEPRLCIEGSGGVGKTHLMLNVAYQCLQTSQTSPIEDSSRSLQSSFFDVIVFISAQSKHCTTHGLLPCLQREKNLWDFFRVILSTLGIQNSLEQDLHAACKQIYESLTGLRVLLTVDHLDKFDNHQELLGFLYGLPSHVKVLITSRRKTPFSSIPLYPLLDSEALRLLQYQTSEKNIFLETNKAEKLVSLAGGLPAVIIYSIGFLLSGCSTQDISAFLLQEEEEFFQFYFAESFQALRGKPAHNIIMALALFSSPALGECIITVAGLRDATCIADSFAPLQNLFLIQKYCERYSLLPLIRRFVVTELEAHAEFELLARERWVNWYIDFVNYFVEDCLQACSNSNSSPLNDEWENITEVIDWCIVNHYYCELQQLWKIVKLYSMPCPNPLLLTGGQPP